MRPEDPVLNFLRNQKTFMSGEDMSRKLKVSRSTVWKEIQALRQMGYDIEAQPHLGYRLVAVPDKLYADEIRFGLKTRFMGQKIFSYEELDSTNDTAFKLGERGLPEGTCVLAEQQKKGRGRLGRTWASPKGKAILFSFILRPKLAPMEVCKVTLVTAISVIRAVRETAGCTLGIKWPNDIVHDSKKVGGILTEMNAEADRVNFVVVGIGLNVNSRSSELPSGALSLKDIVGQEVSRIALMRQLLVEIEQDTERLKKGKFDELAKEWEEYSATTGQRVTATLLDRRITGEATGIDRDGALWIRTESGLQEKIVAGDVEHLRKSHAHSRD